jgi:hypothetical protein
MVQNHMLQLLALVAMEPPTNFDANGVRDEKVKVLRSLRPVEPSETVTPANMAAAPSTASRSPATPTRSAATARRRRSSP